VLLSPHTKSRTRTTRTETRNHRSCPRQRTQIESPPHQPSGDPEPSRTHPEPDRAHASDQRAEQASVSTNAPGARHGRHGTVPGNIQPTKLGHDRLPHPDTAGAPSLAWACTPRRSARAARELRKRAVGQVGASSRVTNRAAAYGRIHAPASKGPARDAITLPDLSVFPTRDRGPGRILPNQPVAPETNYDSGWGRRCSHQETGVGERFWLAGRSNVHELPIMSAPPTDTGRE
jgi:hypothetical protein